MGTIVKFTLTLFFGFQSLVLPCQKADQFNSRFKVAVVGLEELDLKTGDLVLFQSSVYEGVLVEIGTLSNITHLAMVVKDPESSELWLTHSTDNEYFGARHDVINEASPRGGVIITHLEHSFFYMKERPEGFYKNIWIYPLNEDLVKRPDANEVIGFYEKNKHYKFETSLLRYFLTQFDLFLFGRDLFSLPRNDKSYCADYLAQLFKELGFPIENNQKPNDYTPGDICYMIAPLYHAPIHFTFVNGAYRFSREK